MQNKNRKKELRAEGGKKPVNRTNQVEREEFEKDLIAIPNNYTKHFFFYYKLLNSHQNANFHHFS